MPADDLILNVRQIAQYPQQGSVGAGDVVLLQPGLGQPYYTAATESFVSTALAASSDPLYCGSLTPSPAGSGTLHGWWYSGMGLSFNCYLDAAGSGFLARGAGPWCGFFDLDQNAGPYFRWGMVVASPGAGAPVDFGADLMHLDSGGNLTLFSGTLSVAQDPSSPQEVATLGWVSAQLAAISMVNSWNGRVGAVMMNLGDIMAVGGAPIWSPAFQGVPTAPTASYWNSSNQVATTAFTQGAIVALINNFIQTYPLVTTFNGRSGDVVLTEADIIAAGGSPSNYAPLDSPAFTGNPTAPTPANTDDSNSIATTAFVVDAVQNVIGVGYAPLASPAFSGVPTAPTANPGTSTGQLATTAFVMDAITASTTGVASFNTRTGAVVLIAGDLTAAGGALLVSPAFTGNPTAPTATPGTSSTAIATTAFVQAAVATAAGVSSFNTRTGAVTLTLADVTGAGGAPLASPIFTGLPAAPTALPGNSSGQIATTMFVQEAVASAGGVTSFNSRAGAVTLIANDISAVGGALTASPSFSGVPTAPTAAPATATTQLATTAFVMAALTAGNVTSFNTRTGAITLTGADVSSAGGALLAGPSFSGAPTAPTAAPGTNTTQLATTAFVQAALAGSNIVASFNGRSGAVTLSTADVTGAGGAPINSPSFTGVPLAPTASPGANSQQIATTAFVAAAIGSANVVTTFNGRAGAVTLQANDVSGAGGALIASPTFTGTPAAPTAAVGTNTTQLATTAFVLNELNTLGGVTSFNGRAGVVTLTSADVNAPAAGGPYVSVAAAATMQNRNRIINGSMILDQWNGRVGITPTSGQFVCDRWRYSSTQAGKLTSIAFPWNAAGLTQAGLAGGLNFVSTSAYASLAADSFSVIHPIEFVQVADFHWGTAAAAPVVLSFWAYAGAPATYSGAFCSQANNRSYAFSFTITAAQTWQYFSIAIPGDTLASTTNWYGGSAAALSMVLRFDLGSGSSLKGPANTWTTGSLNGVTGAASLIATNAAQLCLSTVQLELGTTPTPFDFRPWTTELQLCQRYYQVLGVQLAANAGAVGNATFQSYPLLVQMRAAPTVAQSGFSFSSNVTSANISGGSTSLTGWLVSNSATNGWAIGTVALAAEL